VGLAVTFKKILPLQDLTRSFSGLLLCDWKHVRHLEWIFLVGLGGNARKMQKMQKKVLPLQNSTMSFSELFLCDWKHVRHLEWIFFGGTWRECKRKCKRCKRCPTTPESQDCCCVIGSMSGTRSDFFGGHFSQQREADTGWQTFLAKNK